MSKLEELMQTLCPDGVEYSRLGNIVVRTKGTPITAFQMKELGKPNAPVKIFAGGKTVAHFDYTDLPEKDVNTFPSVIVKSRGVIEFEYYDKPFSHKNEMWSYHSERDDVDIKFIFHILKTQEKKLRDKATSMGAFPQIAIPDTENLLIPVPPLPIQQEIVRLLDTFTTLEMELEAELAARTKQYEHYRNELLSFDSNSKIMEKLLADFCPDGVEHLELQQIFDYRNGYTPSRKDDENWNNGTISWFTLKDLRKNGGILSESIEKISPKGVKKELFEANSIIISTLATIGEHALILNDALANQQMTCLTRKKEYKDLLSPKFIYYYCFLLGEWCRQNINVSGFASVDMGRFSKFKFPIPPLEIQEKIVSILDRFDALVNDLKSGLPAEIALRRKQYEYYRDQLLTFKPFNDM